MAVEALRRTQLSSFSLEIGHAGFFKAILDDMDIDQRQKAEICSLTESKNFAALSDVLDDIGSTAQTRALRLLPRLFGGVEVLDAAKELYSSPASDSALEYLRDKNCIALVATHDKELTELLGKDYLNYHFSEEIGEDDIAFSYKIMEGPATSQNAVKLLEFAGFPEEIIEAAQEE